MNTDKLLCVVILLQMLTFAIVLYEHVKDKPGGKVISILKDKDDL